MGGTYSMLQTHNDLVFEHLKRSLQRGQLRLEDNIKIVLNERG
jgi:hypothetical protein